MANQHSVVKKNVIVKWETITEIEPHQIYITFHTKDKKPERFPFGIYKIVNNKLIIRGVRTFYYSYGGIKMGVSRYEMPKDFSGILRVFIKVK